MARDSDPNSKEEIGRRLRLVRIAYGMAQGHEKELSQVEFCTLVGISTMGWNNYEKQRNRISVPNARKVSAKTGVGSEYIFWGDPGHLPHRMAVEIEKLEKAEAPKSRAGRR